MCTWSAHLRSTAKTLIDNIQEAGVHSVLWNAENESSGIYFIRMTSGSYSEMKKVMLLK